MASDGKEIRVSVSPDAGASFGKARPGADRTPGSPSGGEAVAMSSEDGESSGGCDPMVKIELDAALALTEFAHLALMACRGPDCRRREGEEKWGGRGRRSTKQRPRSAEVWRSSFEDSEKRASLGDAQAGKEERRLRRIQANRESARQTIRRRQAFCEELMKKAADLSLENKSIKQEIESAMEEYLSLLDTNEHLREQMAEIDRNASPSQDIKETPLEDATCKAGHLMSSVIQFPLVVHSGTTFAQFACPSFLRPLDPARSPFVYSVLNPLTACTSSLPNERWTFGGYSGLRAQVLALPCPSTHSVNNQFSQPLPSTSLSSNSSDGRPDSCPHETDLTLRLAGDVVPKALHGEPPVCSSTMDTTKTENKGEFTETSSGTSMDGRNGMSTFCVKDLTLMPVLGTDQSTLNHKHFLLADSDSRTHVSSVTPCLLSRPSVRVLDKDLHHNKRFSDAAAATEARKRRKELTKLKHRHGKQLKLHC